MSESRVTVELLIKTNNELSLSFVDVDISNFLEPGSRVKEILIKLNYEKGLLGVNTIDTGPINEATKDKIIDRDNQDIFDKYRQGISKTMSKVEYETLLSLDVMSHSKLQGFSQETRQCAEK